MSGPTLGLYETELKAAGTGDRKTGNAIRRRGSNLIPFPSLRLKNCTNLQVIFYKNSDLVGSSKIWYTVGSNKVYEKAGRKNCLGGKAGFRRECGVLLYIAAIYGNTNKRKDADMLTGLYAKNFAIIDEIEVEFGEHLNVISGETGAGKSVIIGTINAALGGKVTKDIIRAGADAALVELTFRVGAGVLPEGLEEQGLSVEDGELTLSRKITAGGKNIFRL